MSPARRTITVIVGLTVAVEIVMIVTDMGPNVYLVAALSMLVGVSVWVFSAFNGEVARPSPPPVTSHSGARPDVDRRVSSLRRVIMGGRRRSHSDDQLYETLVELIDDQLLFAHDLDRCRDPAAAHAIVGDELFEFVTDDAASSGLSRPRRLNRVVTLIEQI